MIIQHNMPALNARRNYSKNNSAIAKSLEKLSSGFAVNRAADNAAGLAVSEKMRSQLKGIKQAVYNSDDGISLVKTFEGALNEAAALIQRCKQLAAQCANGTYQNEVDRDAIQLEYEQITEEIDHIADTDFNGVYLLNGHPSIEYRTTVERIPYENLVHSQMFDDDGNPVLDPESYRLTANYSGSPFGTNGRIAPVYTTSTGVEIRTEYGNGSTSSHSGTVTGTYTDSNGNTVAIDHMIFNDHESLGYLTVGSPVITQDTDSNGDTIYTSTRTYTFAVNGDTNETFSINVAQVTSQLVEYLENADGDQILDSNGDPIVTGRLWTMAYEVYVPDSVTNFTLDSVSFTTHNDTYLNSDSNERYYTSDNTEGGPIDQERLYTEDDMIDSFSIYYYDLHNETYQDKSNRIDINTGAGGPDRVKLGSWGGSGGYRNPINSYISEQRDWAYSLYWDDRTASDGSVSFIAGARGLVNSNSDTNVWPKVETGFHKLITKEGFIQYNEDIPLVLQVGARTKDSVEFTFEYDIKGIGDLECDLNCTAYGLGMDKLDMRTQESANYAIDQLDHSLAKISMVRSSLGAVQNRLEHKIDNLNSSFENITAAESKIRDTDMAREMAEFTKNQIMANAAQAMLAQANTLPQGVLSLLGQ